MWDGLCSAQPIPHGHCYCGASVTFVSQVMSILSPGLILSSNVGSATRRLYRQSFGPTTLIDCAFLSTSVTVTVIVLSMAAVPPASAFCPMEVDPAILSTGASPGGFSLAVTVLLYVADTLSPTLN